MNIFENIANRIAERIEIRSIDNGNFINIKLPNSTTYKDDDFEIKIKGLL